MTTIGTDDFMADTIGTDDFMADTIGTDDFVADIISCQLGNVNFTEVFQNPRLICVCVAAAILLTLPALSVYKRNTEERPEKTYKFSCLVKLIVAFLSTSALVGDIYLTSQKVECNGRQTVKIDFIAAFMAETVEFLFDFGRLVVFWSDPGKIDFYQNVRWGSGKVGHEQIRKFFAFTISSLSVAVLMLGMWICVSFSNFDLENWFGEDGEFGQRRMFIAAFALFGALTSSCLGAYYLCRMICPCQANKGEQEGTGFFWGRWKIVALDLPSLLSVIFRGSSEASSLMIFWSLETFNDLFPLIGTYAFPRCLERDDADEKLQNQGDDNDSDDDDDNNFILTTPISVSSKEVMHSAHQKNSWRDIVKKRKKRAYELDNGMPEVLASEMTDAEWMKFKSTMNSKLQAVEEARLNFGCKNTFKFLLILLATIGYMIYWAIFFSVTSGSSSGEESNKGYVVIVILLYFAAVVVCLKGCYRRDLSEMDDRLEEMEIACKSESEKFPRVAFSIKQDGNLGILRSLKGVHQSRKLPRKIVRSIECRVRVERNDTNEAKTDLFPVKDFDFEEAFDSKPNYFCNNA